MMEAEQQKICVFPTKSNPPNIGMIIDILNIGDVYDKIYIAYYDSPILLRIDQCIELLNAVFSRVDSEKYTIIKTKHDFSNINDMPSEFKELGVQCVVTTSNHIYSNCMAKEIPVQRMLRTKGFNDIYQQIAYNRSYIYESIRGIFKDR